MLAGRGIIIAKGSRTQLLQQSGWASGLVFQTESSRVGAAQHHQHFAEHDQHFAEELCKARSAPPVHQQEDKSVQSRTSSSRIVK